MERNRLTKKPIIFIFDYFHSQVSAEMCVRTCFSCLEVAADSECASARGRKNEAQVTSVFVCLCFNFKAAVKKMGNILKLNILKHVRLM